MGFFSGIRRRIKKLIPKEVRPFIPYAAAMIPGLQAMGPLSGIGSMAARKALIAGGTKFLTDDEADLKDIARTSALAAAPDFLSDQMQMGANRLNLAQTGSNVSKTADALEKGSQYIKGIGGLKTVGAQGSVDYGIKAAELNEDALADYNRMLSEQGIADKAGRRAAIRAIYSNTGTWDMDEVDSMLDTYGYRTGGRVGYEDGGSVITLMDGTTVQIPEGSYTSSGSLKDRIYSSSRGDLLREEIIRELSFAKGGRVGYEDGGETKKERRRKKFTEGFEYAQEGLSALEDLEDEYKPLPIRELRLADGGRVSELKAAYQRYLDMARKDGSKKIIPFEIFAEEFARENFARGGITDINMEEQIDTPSGDMMMDENVEVASNPEVMDSLNELSLMLFRRPLSDLSDDEYEELKDFAGQTSLKPGLIDEYRNYKYNAEEQGQTPMSPRDYFRMEFGAARMGVKKGGPIELNINVGGNNMEDIKGQTAGPDWYYDRMQALEFEFGDELTEEEIADIAFDSEKFYDKMGYEPGDYKKGGKVIELMPKGILYKGKAKDYPGIKQLIKDMKKKGTRPKKAEGGLMSMGGNEMDLRGGGFVPMGAKERADDVPARLSKNEFVMTADAVRGAGGGSVQKGADLMYDQMKRLEGQA